MKNYLVTLLLSVIIINAFAQKQDRFQIDKKYVSLEDGFNFNVIGDWGRKGEEKQKTLANTMGDAAKVIEPEFIISTGDNFYPNGVASVQDPQWNSSFENVYSDFSLNTDWYVVLGNHDYRGNVQAEIDYTSISRRWNMPDRYFTFTKTIDDGATIQFLFIDTSPLNDEYYHEKKYKNAVAGTDTTAQLNWLRKELTASTATWKIVIGHHPLYTGGKRINDQNFVRPHVEPILREYNVDFYIAGHEHDLQYIKPDGPTHHIVSGAGSEVRKAGILPTTKFAQAIQGFANFSITKSKCQFQFLSYEGKVLYTGTVEK